MHDHFSNSLERANRGAQVQIPADLFKPFVCNHEFEDIDYGDGTIETVQCDSQHFTQVFQLKTYEGLLSQGQRVIMQVPAFKCVACNKVHYLA